MDRPMEERHLAIADRIIAEGEARVERQLALIERLDARGADTSKAKAFLSLLRETLAGWDRQRDQIVAALDSRAWCATSHPSGPAPSLI